MTTGPSALGLPAAALEPGFPAPGVWAVLASFEGLLGGVPQATETATLVGLVVTASLPFYLYGAWIVIDSEVVTWSVLMRHLRYIAVGLALTTVPMVVWMVPQLFTALTGLRAVHVFFGLQAYAFLLFALTGIVHIFQAKRKHSLYEDPGQDVDISELHENMGAWRFRLRVGVFGYLLTWLVAWLLGLILLWLRWKPWVL